MPITMFQYFSCRDFDILYLHSIVLYNIIISSFLSGKRFLNIINRLLQVQEKYYINALDRYYISIHNVYKILYKARLL